MDQGTGDAHLVGAALAGDAGAFEELARRYRDAVFGIAFHRLGDFEAARDVAQEALVTAYVDLPMLREPARFAHWLYRITTAAAITEVRRRRPALPLDAAEHLLPAGPQSDPAEAFERAERSRQVRGVLAGLPEPDRLAVILHYVNGYSHEEIGGILGATVPAVKSRVHRARRRLREEMLAMVESNLKSEARGVEFGEDLARVSLRRCPGEHGGVAILDRVWMPFRVEYTVRTREAIAKIASELAAEGYSWLVGPPHIPDGSPALSILKGLGFQVQTEMPWCERALKGRLPKAPPLPAGCAVRSLAQSDPSEVTELLHSTTRGTAMRIPEEVVAATLQDAALVGDASLAIYNEGRLSAMVTVLGIREEMVHYAAGTALLWWAAYHADIGSPAMLMHLIGACLRPLKDGGFRRVVSNQLQTGWPRDQETAAMLERLGFRRIRSRWNLRLDLKAWAAGTVGRPEDAAAGPGVPVRSLRPLRFSVTEMAWESPSGKARPDLAEALEVLVRQVLGTSPVVAPGEVYVVSGEYTLRRPVVPWMTLACSGTSTGNPVPLAVGTHPFDASAEVKAVVPGKERVLQLNLMGAAPDAVVRVRIELGE